MIQIQLQPEIEAQLAAEAQARGEALHHYIEKILIARPVELVRRRTVAEAIGAIRELRKGDTLGGLAIGDLIREKHDLGSGPAFPAGGITSPQVF